MLSEFFLTMALISPEWVIWLLALLSVYSVGLIIERFAFYKKASRDREAFKSTLVKAAKAGEWNLAYEQSKSRNQESTVNGTPDFESGISSELIHHRLNGGSVISTDAYSEIAHEVSKEAITSTRLKWEKNLAILATIGSNAPFIGLFGTVLGIIQAFNDLSQQAQTGVTSTITAGLAEALVATAIGILVAIPSVVAFNMYQRRVRAAVAEAEAFKSFLIGRLVQFSGNKGT